MLRGVLRDFVGEAGVILNEHEPTVGMVLLPRAVKHLGLDLVVLGASLAPCGVQWLVEILDKVGRLPLDKEHLVQASSETKHLLSITGQPLERVGRPAPGWWWRPA